MGQWQAHEPPQAPALAVAVAVSLLAAGAAALVDSPALAGLAELPPLKSVAYQPEPLSWKPAAVSCLEKLD